MSVTVKMKLKQSCVSLVGWRGNDRPGLRLRPSDVAEVRRCDKSTKVQGGQRAEEEAERLAKECCGAVVL